MSSIKFVTDSAADIPAPLRAQYNIQMLPFPISVDGKEYMDGVDLTPTEFYAVLEQAQAIPTHSQLTPFYFSEQFNTAYQEGCNHLIYTCINAKASATYQNALQARDLFFDEHPDARDSITITILDSRCYTMGYGYGVLRAAKAVAEDGASAEQAIAIIQDWIDHEFILFTPYDLKFAKKSGRVKAAAAVLGDALGLRPIMTFENGESKVLSKVRGDKALIPAMLKLAQEHRAEGTPYIQLKGSYEKWNEEMTQTAPTVLGDAPVVDCYIGGVISINAGHNVVGLVFYKK